MISGLSQAQAAAIEQARSAGPFGSLDDVTRRTGLSRAVVLRLAEADAFNSLGRDRRNALWEALSQHSRTKSLPLFDALPRADEPLVELPKMRPEEEVIADYRASGLSLRAHPLSFHRPDLDELGITTARILSTLTNNRHVRVAGLVLLRQRPSTARGITFVTLEDETGVVNLVVRQQIWDRYYVVARTSPAWIAHGKLESKGSVIHVVVNRIEDLSAQLGKLQTKSRDLR
jgi:error-prone DNA polymerase